MGLKVMMLRGGRINGDIRGSGVCGSDAYDMIIKSGDLWGFL